MNEPYSRRYARNSADNPILADRYTSADPIRWNGSMIYPMYTEPLGPAPKLLTMALLSAAPPAGLRGHGIGLSMVDGYIDLDGRHLGGVDVWSDALYSGVTFELTPTGPGALFTLTPVWVDALGVQKSWMGNYGILVEDIPDGRIALWCSIGEGPPNFANLVVALLTTPAPARPVDGEPAEPAPLPVRVPLARPRTPVAQPDEPQQVRDEPPPPEPEPAVWEPAAAIEDTEITRPHHFGDRLEHETHRGPDHEPRAASDRETHREIERETRREVEHEPRGQSERDRRASGPPGPESEAAHPTAGGADPGFRSALYDLGVAMYARGDEEQACTLWEQAATAGHPTAAYDLGVVRYRRGDQAGAEHWWRTAADLSETRAMAGLSELLDRQGNHAEAQMWRTRAAREAGRSAGSS
ncbi:tetratricopeptide repeat protein [Nocardia bovistercoris]|uniref:Tetratricopeptide repeat protein n=1 Tax=Nocardia bovistercoris TaxID=2785916 RepID=A0A931N2E1_9NOCA|nr:tetratricopeptide repeat protein [Nocardia bovistercoris]MBH0779405.1 tetratricopeptide repeat protein [Nocardia bovistercoris]